MGGEVGPEARSVIQPYLMFGGRCEEAIEFYKGALGATVDMLTRFNESPQPPPPGVLAPGFEAKVMHCAFRIGATQILASDACDDKSKFDGFSLSLTVPTAAEAERVCKALADGGNIRMPLGKTFWSPCLGMVADRFGLGRLVIAPE
jgi:PhnB protein